MASSLEGNKLLAAVLVAGILASGTGVISHILYSPHDPEEDAYPIEVADAGESAGEEAAPVVEPIAVRLASADIASGEKVAKKCVACHVFDEGGANKIGPVLWDVVMRDIAAVDGFAYSDALAGKEGVWDYEALDHFLASPKDWAPGTKMSFAGLRDPGDRADMILYLHSLSSNPAPLPEAEAAEDDAADAAAPAEEPATEDAAATEATADEAPSDTADAGAAAETAETATADAGEAAADGAAAAGEGGALATLVAAGDPEKGAKVARKCKACHDFTEGGKDKVGPNLWGIVGRDIASRESFNYSDALTSKEGAWDLESLDHYVTSPKDWAPGNKMTFAGLRKEEDRVALLAYLNTLR